MKISNYKKFLEEVNLSLDILKKPSKQDSAGPLRGDVLVKKIKDGEEIKTKDDEEVEIGKQDDEGKNLIKNITTSGKYDADKAADYLKKGTRYKYKFVDDEDKSYRLSDFVKVKDFGGESSGSSLGTKGTRFVESIQTIVFGYKQYMDSQSIKYFDKTSIENAIKWWVENSEAEKFVKIPTSITESTLNSYESYIPTFIKTANFFINHKEEMNPGDISLNTVDGKKHKKTYVFYQISYLGDFMNVLNDAYKRCVKQTIKEEHANDKETIPRSNTVNISKWTPSDVWAVNISKEEKIKSLLKEADSMITLNLLIDELFDKRDLVGISLKKIGDSVGKRFPIIINKESKRPIYKFLDATLSPNPFTKNTKVTLRRYFLEDSEYATERLLPVGFEDVSIRSTSSSVANINLEVVGASSRHGKVSLETINHILRNEDLATIEDAKSIESSHTGTAGYDDLISEVGLLDSYLKRKHSSEDTLDIERSADDKNLIEVRGRKPTATDIRKNKASLISKYQALSLVKVFIESNDKKAVNRAINSIMYHALSIQNRYFMCPKYARVIEYI